MSFRMPPMDWWFYFLQALWQKRDALLQLIRTPEQEGYFMYLTGYLCNLLIFFFFFFWNRMTCLTHMWFIPFFSKELPPSPSFILVYLHCDIFCFSIFCLSLLTASYFPIIFFNSTKYFCRTMTSQLYQYLLLLRVFYLPILPSCDILYRA